MNEDQEPVETGKEPVVRVSTTVQDEEASRKRAREFDDAIYAALTCRAQSDQARALVDQVLQLVTEAEAGAGKRTNKRGKKQSDLRGAVEGFLADLLRAQSSERTHGYVYRSMRPAGFTEGDIGYRIFTALVDAMVSLDLVDSYGGFLSRSGGFGDGPLPYIQKATRFRATQRLLDLCESHGIQVADVHQHFLLPLPEHPLLLRATSKTNALGKKISVRAPDDRDQRFRLIISGRKMRYERTEATETVERQLKKLNAFFDGFKLTGGVHRGYLRIFNNGDDPAFNWNMGGRLYSYGEGNYQQMSREQRLKMRIGLDRVCEIDIRASYLTILHAWLGERFDPKRDPYDIPGLGCHAACTGGHSVLFTTAIDIVNTLAAAQSAGQLKREIRRYVRPTVLIIDELGYLPIDKHGADLLFQIISGRYERAPMVITTNRAYKHWAQIFNNDSTLTSAILDRVMHHVDTVVIEGKSFRMKDEVE